MKIKFTLVALLMLATSSIMAQFSLSGEFRPRTEWRDGFNYKYQPTGGNTAGREGTDGYILTDARVALAAKYAAETYTAYIAVQEVFTFGDRQQISAAGNGNIRMQEAWADIKLSGLTSFKLGRQPLSYDDQRILGGLGWAQQARTHDVGIVKYANNGYSLDAGFGYNTSGGNNVYDVSALFSYKNIAFLRVNKKYEALNLSVLALHNTFQDSNVGPENSNLFTGGVHFDYKPGALSFSGNAFIQDGERVGQVAVEAAYLASLDVNFKATEKTTFGLGAEVISGKTDTSVGFFPLYGTNHKFNGLMDRFYVGNHAVGNGLVDLNVTAATKIFKTYNLKIKGHMFSEQSQTKNSLGQEIDLVVSKKFKEFSLAGGYSQFFESDDYPNPAKSLQNWAWLMLTIKPSFL